MVIMRVKQQDGSVVDIPIGKGTDGEDGLSAYEIWLQQGNEGTEEDFLESLKGSSCVDVGGVKSVNNIKPDENGNVFVEEFSEEKVVLILEKTSLIARVRADEETVYTDKDGKVFLF